MLRGRESLEAAGAVRIGDRAALEVVFHEAVDFLTGNDSPLSMALASALKESGGTPPRMDLVHTVQAAGDLVRALTIPTKE